jgi:DNA-binding beta-propeller fold protein YncE
MALAQDVTVTPTPVLSYGVQWFKQWTLADGDSAFVNLVGATYSSGNFLYTVDAQHGVLQLDAASGELLSVFPNPALSAPSDVAADSAGTVYVADVSCGCILVLDATGVWQREMGGFRLGAPLSIAVGPGSIVYAADYGDNGSMVRVFQAGSERTIAVGIGVSRQPLLAADGLGQLLAVTDNRMILALQGDAFAPLSALTGLPSGVNDLAMAGDGSFVVSTSTAGIAILNSNGEVVDRLGRIVANYPLAGEVVNPRGVAIGPEGMIYWVDSDGQFGAVTAMGTESDAVRANDSSLVLDVPVQGQVSDSIPQQRWTFNAIAGQQVTINAAEAVHDSGLDVAVRLLAPDGSEEAYNDDQQGGDLYGIYDAQIPQHRLTASGAYSVVVEWVQGEGAYRLGITSDHALELSADGVTRIEGQLHDVFPTQRWQFAGRTGQVFTITMQADPASTLDPLLRLLAPNGQVIARNDDAADPALGVNAQLVRVTLPTDGTYVLEASRFEGEGVYTLVIVAAV